VTGGVGSTLSSRVGTKGMGVVPTGPDERVLGRDSASIWEVVHAGRHAP